MMITGIISAGSALQQRGQELGSVGGGSFG